MFWKRGLGAIAVLLGLWLGFDLLSTIAVEALWFNHLGYTRSFWLRAIARAGLLLLAAGISGSFLLLNLFLADRLKYPQEAIQQPSNPGKNPYQASASGSPSNPSSVTPLFTRPLRLRLLLPLVLGLGFLVGVMVLYYGVIAIEYWGRGVALMPMFPNVPEALNLESGWQFLLQLPSQKWQLLLLLGLTVSTAIAPQILYAIATGLSLGFALVLSGHWTKVLQFFRPTAFNFADPIFSQNIGFYIFKLPIFELLEFWLSGLFLYAFISVAIVYFVSGNSLSEGKFPGFSPWQRRHVQTLGSGLMLLVSLGYWLSCYRLLYSSRGFTYGASFTDIKALLPAYIILSLTAGAVAIVLIARLFVSSIKLPSWKRKSSQLPYQNVKLLPHLPHLNTSHLPVLRTLLIFYLFVMGLAGYILPVGVQRLIVQPNELERETPYIERSISFTRAAFGLDKIEAQNFAPRGQLSYRDIEKNDLTIRNIRLWDSRPLLQTNRELQQIRPYYKFPDADIDRYTLKKEFAAPGEPQAEQQQVFLAARELDYTALLPEAKTWINEHLVYTHGYGFTLSPVNTVAPGGLPDYFVKDIGVDAKGSSTLGISSERIRSSIPIGNPRIYYGDISDTYIMAPSEVLELDYPRGEDNAYNNYDGSGGVTVGNWWRRLVFANYLKNWQMLFTRNFTPETKVLFHRSIKERIKTIAPFLRYDRDPYLVVANTRLYNNSREEDPEKKPNYLYWMVDAYTTSDRYPYSDPGQENFNYIRNSVKVVIDAYNGSVNFYVANPEDPIIQTWQAIFPGMFQPLDAMPVTLRAHIRYPVDLFAIQSQRLLVYHMTEPQVFYNREDQWQVPTEIYRSEQKTMEPYYLILKLPDEQKEEFILLLPFTPTGRNNLIGWLAGRSDSDRYGKLLLYQFPKQQLIYGPDQVEARINQDPVISQQISLWNQEGSRAIQGNLLVIPIEQSLLYVEPLYIEAEQNSIPTLAKVILVYENSIVMADNLDLAIKTLFKPEKPVTPVTEPIIRLFDNL